MSITQQPVSPPGRRWGKIAIKIGIPVLFVGLLLIIKPEIITGTLETTDAMLRVGAVILGWLVFSFLVRRFVRPPLLRTGLIAVIGLVLLAMTVLPYFINTRANDALLTAPAGAATGGIPGSTTAAGPVRVSSGQLKGLAGHRGSGTASIVRVSDGSYVVQLEDYDVSSGVTLFLYVVPGANREEPRADAINLGKLAENTGNRVVRLPAGTELTGPQTVLIWCEPFTTPIAAATQTSV